MNINKNDTHQARSFSDFKTRQSKRELTGLSHDGKTPRAQRIIFKKQEKKKKNEKGMETTKIGKMFPNLFCVADEKRTKKKIDKNIRHTNTKVSHI